MVLEPLQAHRLGRAGGTPWRADASWRSPATSPWLRRTPCSASPELKFGAGIVVMLLPWLTSPKRAKEVLLTGEDRIPAREAERMGLVNRVVPGADLLETALAIAQKDGADEPGHSCGRPRRP